MSYSEREQIKAQAVSTRSDWSHSEDPEGGAQVHRGATHSLGQSQVCTLVLVFVLKCHTDAGEGPRREMEGLP